eukprot:2068090-Rhodomonas_salina.1
MSGSDLAHGAILLRACYAMSGTEIAYGATRTWQTLYESPAETTDRYCDVRYWHSVWYYAMSGTDLASVA